MRSRNPTFIHLAFPVYNRAFFRFTFSVLSLVTLSRYF